MELKIDMPNKTEFDTLSEIALENNLTVEEYATNIILGWIQNHIKEVYIGNIRRLPTDEIVTKMGSIKKAKAFNDKGGK